MAQKTITYIPVSIPTKRRLEAIKTNLQNHIGRKVSFEDVIVSILGGN